MRYAMPYNARLLMNEDGEVALVFTDEDTKRCREKGFVREVSHIRSISVEVMPDAVPTVCAEIYFTEEAVIRGKLQLFVDGQRVKKVEMDDGTVWEGE